MSSIGSGGDAFGDAALEAQALQTWRRLALAGGVVSIVTGLILLLWPDETLLVAAALIGIWLVIAGIMRLAESVLTSEARGSARVLSALAGLLYLIVGILCLRNLLKSLEVLAVVIGIVWIAGGISEIMAAFTRLASGGARLAAMVIGLITVLGGIVLVFWPDVSLRVIIWVSGLWLVAIGVVQLVLAARVRKAA
ncbi:MAG TPA: DUF308 domain-containing protein [Micromonosporaceae bacterium]